ncbi:MAG: SpoIIE family protein phosphatase [Lawsonibacter sp.]|nr:SpoIIE family protein phosphatase [Lawsonibacter sp.]
MTAKTIYSKLSGLRRQPQKTGQAKLSTSALLLAAETGIHFLLAAVLAGAVIFEDSAPFGVALVGAAGSGLCGGAALVGACFGAMTTLGFSDGLRYASAAILTFAVAFAFYDWKVLRRPWAMPVVAGLLSAATGFIVQSQWGWQTADIIYFVLETALTGAAAWAFRGALAPVTGRAATSPTARLAGTTALLCACLVALAPLRLHENISLGRILAVLAVVTAAWQGGTSAGALLGAAAGLSMDLAGQGIPLYAMAYGLSGLAAGTCRGRSRIRTALVYTLANGAAVLWTWNRGLDRSVLYEILLGGAVFLLLPEGLLRRLGTCLSLEEGGSVDLRAQRIVQQKLEHTSQAFRALYDSLRSAFHTPDNDNDVATVFDRAAGRQCRGCTLRDRCWKADYNTTFNALNDATPAMVERGRAEARDFPRHFADRCIHFPDFVAVVNEELTALFYRRQYNARIRESRAAVCRQYAQLSDLLGEAAAELSRELTPDPSGDRRLRQRLTELGLEVRSAVYRDGRGLLRVEAEGPDCAALARPSRLKDLSSTLGVPLRVELEGESSLSLLQQEPLMAVAGVAARKKSGETVSGDAGTYFKRHDGKLYLLLCDGMGSGPDANRESTLAVRLLEQLLQAGVDARRALATLSSALALRGEETGGFTTVDLLQLDLFTGEGELYKLGAAPTYIKKGSRVERLSGKSLPAGLAEGEVSALDQFSLRLNPGDCVLMVSDGVCSPTEDGWLREQFTRFDGTSPKDLARELVTQDMKDATDDRTALVVRIDKRA